MILFRMEFEISFGAATVDSHIGSCRERRMHVRIVRVSSSVHNGISSIFFRVVETESFGEQFDASFPSYFP